MLVITEEGRGGGAIGRIRLIAAALKGKAETIVLAPDSAPKYISSLQEKYIKAVAIKMHPLSTNPMFLLKYIIWFLPELWSITRVIKKVKPDLVHCNSSWQIKGILAARMMGVRSVWQMNDTYQPKPVLFFFRILSHLPTAFIYASTKTKEYYSRASTRRDHKKEKVIQAPVVRKKTKTERTHQLNKSTTKLILVGYINHHKGIDILIRALAQLEDLSISCDIVGPVLGTRADYKKGLDELAEEKGVRLNYLGYQKVDEQLFEGYDFYCCSSRREASPMSVWEALSYGIPIISNPVGDIAQVVADHQCGIVADDISATSLAEAIREAITLDQASYDLMSKACYKASELFDHDDIAEQYLSFYSEVISA